VTLHHQLGPVISCLPYLTLPVYFNSCYGWKPEYAKSLILLDQNLSFSFLFLGKPRELNYIFPYLCLRQAVLIFSVHQFELLTPPYRNNGTLCLRRSEINEYTGATTRMNFATNTNLLSSCESQVLPSALLSWNDGGTEGSLDFAVMEKQVFGDNLIPLQF